MIKSKPHLLFIILLNVILPLSGYTETESSANSLLRHKISVTTNQTTYCHGDTITITGQVAGQTDLLIPVTLKIIRSNGSLVQFGQQIHSSDGTFLFPVIAYGALWKTEGDYRILVNKGDFSAEASFLFQVCDQLTVDLTSLEFGGVSEGETSHRSFTLTNSGSETVDVRKLEISGPNAGNFIVGDQTWAIQPGTSQKIFVDFTPSSLDVFTASLKIVHNFAADYISLIGGLPCVPSLVEVNFAPGSGAPGCGETNSCYIPFTANVKSGGQVLWSNGDTAAHTVTSGSPESGPDGIFDSGLLMAANTFSHEFDRAGIFPYFCVVHPWMRGVVVADEACSSGVLIIDKRSVMFSDTPVNLSSSTQISLYNSSLQTITVDDIQSVGIDAPRFSTLTLLPLSLAPDETRTVRIDFTPNASRQFNAKLIIQSDLTAVEISLTGSGIASGNLLVASTDKFSYCDHDTITLDGQVTGDFDASIPVTLKVSSPNGNLVRVDQFPMNTNGSFSTSIVAGGRLWNNSGDYELTLFHETISNSVPIDYDNSDCSQGIIYVDNTATGIKNGSSWENAYTNLQDALQIAGAGDEIWVAAGMYIPGPSDVGSATGEQIGDREKSFELKNGVALYGGFFGTETDRESRDSDFHVTTLSGDLAGNDGVNFENYEDNTRRVVTIRDLEDSRTTIDGFTITGADARSVTIGGGMFIENSTVAVHNCRFESNIAEFGGALAISSSMNVSVINCEFIGNRASFGGALYIETSKPVIAECLFAVNEALDGGAVHNLSSDSLFENSEFFDNYATRGGAMFILSSPAPLVSSSTFTNNDAIDGGGIASFGSGDYTLINSVLNDNSAESGGAVYNLENAAAVIVNCTVAGNQANDGDVGGLIDKTSESGSSLIVNSIFWENSGDQISGVFDPVVRFSCVMGGFAGNGNIDIEPGFLNLGLGNLSLKSTSPCIDAGINSVDIDLGTDGVQHIPDIDLAGNSRFVNDPDTSDTGNGSPPIVDMGAFEFQTDIINPDLFLEVETDKDIYCLNDVIVVSGKLTGTVSSDALVSLTVFDSGNNFILNEQLNVNTGGVFLSNLIPGGELWESPGLYRIQVIFDNLSSETRFQFHSDGTRVDVIIANGAGMSGCGTHNSCFHPANARLLVNGQAVWHNDDTSDHTITSGDPVQGPDGHFDSGLIREGNTYSYRFTESGDYPYYCTEHTWMTGVVHVQKTDFQGADFLFQFGTAGNDDDEFNRPTDLAISNHDDTLYVVDSENNRVKIFELTGGSNCPGGTDEIVNDEVCFDDDFGISGSGNGRFDIPTDLAIDKGNGDIYVVDSDNNRVQRFQGDGDFDNMEFGSGNSSDDDYLGSPSAIAIHKASDYIYVADSTTDSISVFDDGGDFLFNFDDDGSGDDFKNPSAMVIDDDEDILYVADTDNNRIRMFELTDGNNCPSGTDEVVNDEVCFVNDFGSSGSGDGRFDEPTGLAFDEDNDLLYVADTENDRIQIFQMVDGNTCPGGTDEIIDGVCFVGEFGSSGSSDGKFNNPGGLALDKANGRLYVADTGNDRVQVFDTGLNQWDNPCDPDLPPVPPPFGLVVHVLSPTSILIAWQAPAIRSGIQIDGYQIEVKVDNSDYIVLDDNSRCPATRFIHSELNPAINYTYRVSAISSLGKSEPSEEASGQPNATNVPAGLIATAISPNQIRLSWHPPSNTFGQSVTGYQIEREVIAGVLYEDFAITQNTDFIIDNLQTGTTYSYVVSAFYSLGSSPRSISASATPEMTSAETPSCAAVISLSLGQSVYANEDELSFVGTESEGLNHVIVLIQNDSCDLVKVLSDPVSSSNGEFETIPQLVSQVFEVPGIYRAIAVTDNQKIENGASLILHYDGNRIKPFFNLVLASFVDPAKDPQSYVDRYNIEPNYKKWFDNNYPEYSSIEEAVGLVTEPEFDCDVNGLMVSVKKGSEISGVGISLNIVVKDAVHTVTITITDVNGQIVEVLEFPVSASGKINQSWIIPRSLPRGIYSVKAEDAFSSDETRFMNPPASIQFVRSTTLIPDESGGEHSIELQLDVAGGGSIDHELEVHIVDKGTGTASANEDYEPFDLNPVKFPAGSADGTIKFANVSIIDDSDVEDDESIEIELLSHRDIVLTGDITNHRITITDDDSSSSILFVDQLATGNNDGSSWTDAFVNLQDALSISLSGDEIWVAGGIYTPDRGSGNTPGDREATFRLISGVKLFGGFFGNETGRDERDWNANETILSGDLSGNDEPDFINNNENTYHVVTGSDSDAMTILDGFVITAGNANGESHDEHGGGMYTINGNPIIQNCIIEKNSANRNGAGMYNESAVVMVKNCSFFGNSTMGFVGAGGGLYNFASEILIEDSDFHKNLGNQTGGGIYNHTSHGKVIHCVFRENTGTNSGGGITNSLSSSIVIVNCAFSSNTSSAGAGIFNISLSELEVSSCFFDNNSALLGGGIFSVLTSGIITDTIFIDNITNISGSGIYNASSSPSILNCKFYSNVSETGGGAIANQDAVSQPQIINCIFSGNTARHGGAISESSLSASTISNCTFSGNSSENNGGALFDPHDIATVYNSIFWGNTSAEGAQIFGIITVTNSLIEGGYNGLGNIDVDPLFIDPDGPDNITGTNDDNLNLQPGSPAIDAGNNNIDVDQVIEGAQPLPHTDLAENPRFIDDPNTQDTGVGTPPIVDMGAYEYELRPAIVEFEYATNLNVPESDQNVVLSVKIHLPNGGVTDQKIWVSFVNMADGTAVLGSDYTIETTNQIRFPVGAHDGDTQSIFIKILDDSLIEGNETVKLKLTSVQGFAVLGRQRDHELTILDDDVPPDILHVRIDATGNNDGSSWIDAFVNLQDALSVALSGDEIWVAGGIYTPDTGSGNTPGERETTFQLQSGVELYGGFFGNEIELADRDWDINETILSGDLNGDDSGVNNIGENSYHVVTSRGTNFMTVIDGFIIQGGNASSSTGRNGGGMMVEDSSVTIIGCTFRFNKAISNGSGLYTIHSELELADCVFIDNIWNGGALYCESTDMTLTACRFNNNQSHYGGGLASLDSQIVLNACLFEDNLAEEGGGGVYTFESTVFVNDCEFSGNIAEDEFGGGMCNLSSEITISDSQFYGNLVEDGEGGGGVYNEDSIYVINNTWFINNDTDNEFDFENGGGIYNYGSQGNIINCQFIGNDGFEGGGIYNVNSPLSLVNSIFSGNTAVYGAGIDNNTSTLEIVNCVFSGNNALGIGGGLQSDCNGSETIVNSIFWENSSDGGSNSVSAQMDNRCDDAFNVSHSIVQNWPTPGINGVLDQNPMFMNARGPDRIVGTSDDNLNILPGSPAINTGDNTSLPIDTIDLDRDGDITEQIPIDLNHSGRIADGNVDIGAYEVSGDRINVSISDLNLNSSNDGQADHFLITLDTATPSSLIIFANDSNSNGPNIIFSDLLENVSIISITGSSDDDTLVVDQQLGRFGISIIFDGITGTDHLSYLETPMNDKIQLLFNSVYDGSTSVTFSNIDSLAIRGLAGNDQIVINASFDPIGTVFLDGNSGNDSIQGPDSDFTWTLNGDNGGQASSYIYQNIENLAGGSANDLFIFQSGAVATGLISAGLGIDQLDYTSYGPTNIDVLERDQTGYSGTAMPSIVGGFSGINFVVGVLPKLSVNNVSAFEGQELIFTVRSSFPISADVACEFTSINGSAMGGIDYTSKLGILFIPSGETEHAISVVSASDSEFEPDETMMLNLSNPQNATIAIGQGIGTIINRASPIYVKWDAGGNNDGSSWTNAYINLQDALVIAQEGDEVWIAAGSYTPDIEGGNQTGDRHATFHLISGVEIYGGFIGTESLLTQRDISMNETILSGDLNGDDDAIGNSENALHVVTADDVDELGILDGCIITGGNDDRSSSLSQGGGINIINHSSPRIRNCKIDSNVVYFRGGGVFCVGGEPLFKNCIFSNNHAKSGGGFNSIISRVTFNNCFFKANSATSSGGGVYVNADTVKIFDCIFEDNTADTGGGLAYFGTTVIIDRCIFRSNSAETRGGGIYASYYPLSLSNSLIIGNTASEAGAIYASQTGIITNCTIVGNEATNLYGGVFFSNTLSYPNSIVTNTIIWDNRDQNGTGITSQLDSSSEEIPVVSFSIIQGWFSSETDTNSNQDPLFVNAGGVDNIFGTIDDDVRLSPLSPSIDAGDNHPTLTNVSFGSYPTILTPFDVSGNPRFVDDPNTSDTGIGTPPIIDMGAFEFVGSISEISVSDSSIAEGTTTSNNLIFNISLSKSMLIPVSIDYQTVSNSAIGGDDYEAIDAATLVFNPGETDKSISISINNDPVAENDETFFINLSNPQHATIVDSQGVGTIVDDDLTADTPTLTVNDSSGNEDTPIPLHILSQLTDSDGSEVLSISLSRVKGSLSGGVDAGNGNWNLTASDLNGLTLTPPSNFAGDFSINATATSKELANDLTHSISKNIDITISKVNDKPSFNKGADLSIWDDGGVQIISNWATNISAGAADESDQELTFFVTTDNSSLFSQLPFIHSSSGNLKFMPSPNSEGVAMIFVQLRDNGGTALEGIDTSIKQTFKIRILPSSMTQEITVKRGWNLISLNVHPNDMSPRQIFNALINLNGSNILQKIVGEMKNFDPNLPDSLNTLTTIKDGVGYWIKVSENTTFSVTGRQIEPDRTITLKAGWNNIGYLLQSSQNVRTILADIIGSANVEKVIGDYESFDMNMTDSQNSLKKLKPGAGYWIKVKQDQSFPLRNVSTDIFCTADVKQCPDGSFVSRDPNNNCEFGPCSGFSCTHDVKECPDGSFVSRDPKNGCEFRRCP